MGELTSYERLVVGARWLIILAILLLIYVMHQQVNHGELRTVLAPVEGIGARR